jgi:hypothetical protein
MTEQGVLSAVVEVEVRVDDGHHGSFVERLTVEGIDDRDHGRRVHLVDERMSRPRAGVDNDDPVLALDREAENRTRSFSVPRMRFRKDDMAEVETVDSIHLGDPGMTSILAPERRRSLGI